MIETKNAIIGSYSLSNADHGCLSMWVHLEYEGSGQGFGGYNLYSKGMKGGNYCGLFIDNVMKVCDVTELSGIVGKTVRVKASHSKVDAIGHIIKDIWFNPSEELCKLDE